MKKIFQYVAILVAGFSLMACDFLAKVKVEAPQQSRKRRNQVPYQQATKR